MSPITRMARSQRLTRRTFAASTLAAALGAVALSPLAASASDWPQAKPIRLVVPFPAGSSPDMVARMVAQPLEKRLSQTIVIDNRPGAGGNIGTGYVARADADGYTLLFTINGPLATAPTLYSKLPYDPLKDLAPITTVATSPNVLVVSNSLGVNTVKEFAEAVRSQPGKLNYGSVGAGSSAHLGAELLKGQQNLDILHVPYKSFPEVITAIISGQVQAAIMVPSVAMPQANEGKVKALAVTSAQRSKTLAQLPTMIEEGFKGYEVISWQAILAPAGTPQAIVDRLNKELVEIIRSEEVTQQLANQYWTSVGSSPQELTDLIKRETDTLGAVIKRLNLSLD